MNCKFFLVGFLLMASLPLMAERVDPETARKAATTFFSNNGTKSAQLTDLTKEVGLPNLYIFNATQGFVVMAADDCAQPILGYSLTGKFVTENMPSHVSGWLQDYNDEIQYAIENQVKASESTAKLWKDLIKGDQKAGRANIIVPNFLLTTWDQDPGYNDLCPYDQNAGELTVTGCVATAMAQIMKYWEYPNHGEGSHAYTPSTHPEYGVQSVNYGSATYDWSNMPLDHSNAEVAKLMYHCGVSVDMDYDIAINGGSSASTNSVVNALQTYYNYQPCTVRNKNEEGETAWVNLLKAELDAQHPLQYSGRGSAGGHSFVCCGYDDSNRFYFNWGWSGRNDGYYALNSLVPGSGGSGGGSYNFTQDQSAIFGIQPVQCTSGEPSNLLYTLNGFSVTLTWTAGEGAASYNIYRNGILLDNTTNTSYTDNSINYGTYTYYVKSKDANGSQSLPTETITITLEPVPTNLTVTLNGSNAALSWDEPEWSAPQSGDEMLTYGTGNMSSMFGVSGAKGFYGHRYPVSMLGANKVLYKVSFYAAEAGSFALHVYSATAGSSKPKTLLLNKNITVASTGWREIELAKEEFIHINNSQDLWVFIYDPESKQYPMGIESYTSDDGCYFSAQEANGPTSWISKANGATMLIRSYITDDSFQYQLYDNDLLVATDLSGTSYTLSNIADNTAHQYTLKALFNDGETSASNMAGITLGNATIPSLELADNDKMTVTENSILTVSGTLSNNVAANLVLKNGAQLINNSTDVAATVEKAITAYTNEGGWYTVAAPFTSFNPIPFTTNEYDLYVYAEDETLEWINYKANQTDFPASPYSGYLYANNTSGILAMTGTLNSGNYSTNITLSYANPDAGIKGYHLLGNPTPHEITFSKTSGVSDGYYYLDNGDRWVYEASNTVPAGQGFLVKANEEGQSVTLNPQNKRGGDNEESEHAPYIFVDVDGERTYVKMTKGVNMPLLDFKGRHSSVYLARDNKKYIMFANEKAQNIDLCYEPKYGQHQLNVSLKGANPGYLHLIDRLTGADIDLLATPSYDFKSTANDYPFRFMLVLNAESINHEDSETFAFVNDGNIIINGKGILQVFDMLGHQLFTKELSTINSQLSTPNSPGVYMLQLITDNETKTQKIIIK